MHDVKYRLEESFYKSISLPEVSIASFKFKILVFFLGRKRNKQTKKPSKNKPKQCQQQQHKLERTHQQTGQQQQQAKQN